MGNLYIYDVIKSHMAIKLYKEVFIVFYDELYSAFKKVVDPENKNKLRKNDRSLWDYPVFNSKAKAFPLIFAGKTYPWYWSEKLSLHKNSTYGFKEEPSGAIANALSFLGCEIPEYLAHMVLDDDMEARVLLQVFLEKTKVGMEYLIMYPDLIVFDSENGILLPENEKEFLPNLDYQRRETIKEQLTNFVNEYYKHINTKQYNYAWEMLYKELKGQFDNDINSFILSYSQLITMNNIHVFDIKEAVVPDDVKKEMGYDQVYLIKVYGEKTCYPLTSELKKKFEKALEINIETENYDNSDEIYYFDFVMKQNKAWSNLNKVDNINQLVSKIYSYYSLKYNEGGSEETCEWYHPVKYTKLYNWACLKFGDKWYLWEAEEKITTVYEELDGAGDDYNFPKLIPV